MTLCARMFQRSVSPHALAGSLRPESETALMPQLRLCGKRAHSKACHFSHGQAKEGRPQGNKNTPNTVCQPLVRHERFRLLGLDVVHGISPRWRL